jgi:hypothetical protein
VAGLINKIIQKNKVNMGEAMIKKSLVILILLPLLSVFIVAATLILVPVNVQSYEEFQEAKFGLPIPYIRQDLLKSGAGGYEGGFPHKFELQMDFLDKDPEFEFILPNFLYSISIIYLSILISIFLFQKGIRLLK